MKEPLRWIFSSLFFISGIGHFARTKWFLRLMPPYLPRPRELVLVSGAAELVLGAMLLVPACSRLAAWGLMALLVAVFPANLHMALKSGSSDPVMPGISPFLSWARLPIQGLLIAWAYWYA